MYLKKIFYCDSMGFAEAYISYFGTVFLGFVALYQNVKLNKKNRKLEGC